MKNIANAFINAQSQMGNAKKDSKNPFFKSSYADLNSILGAVLPALHENNIAVLQPTVTIEGKSYVKTILLHESGETLEGFTEIIFSKSNDAQAQGSGITYARRYGLQSLCGIGAEDDDGNYASQKESAENKLKSAKNIEELASIYGCLTKEEKERCLNLKDELKKSLSNVSN